MSESSPPQPEPSDSVDELEFGDSELGESIGDSDLSNPHEEHPVISRLNRGVTLGSGARGGGLWLGLSSVGVQVFQFGISLVMARLLLPSQFGETALVYSLTGFAAIFTDLGLGAAVVQARRVTENLITTAFWLNALTGLFLTLLVAGLARPLAEIYHEPQLEGLLIVSSLDFVLTVGTVQLALLERTFHFRKIAIIETTVTIVGLAAMPLADLAGFGIYSLVIGPLVNTVMLSVWLWAAVPWRPSLQASRSAMRQLWVFSRGLVGFTAVNYWARNLDNVLLGGRVPRATLGEYNRAYNLMMIPVGQVGGVFMRGLYPVLSRMQDDPRRMGDAFVRAMQAAIGGLSFPITFTFAATAPAFIVVCYGTRWAHAVPLLEILSLAAVPQIIGAGVGGPLRAVGETGLMLKLGLGGTASAALAIVIGLHWGATGVAVAILVRAWLWLVITMVPLARIFERSLLAVIRPLLLSALPGLMMGAGEFAVRLAAGHRFPLWQVLLLQIAVGVAIFVLVMWRSQSVAASFVREQSTMAWRGVRRRILT
jgi:O-antigen/teichoic acid export membrane protein